MKPVLCLPVALCLVLAACELKGKTPHVEFDKIFPKPKAATKIKEPEKPVRFVSIPEPVPMPGQLKKKPDTKMRKKGKKQKQASPDTNVKRANKAARIEPVKDGYINAMQVYPFMEGALYQLYAAVNQVSDIRLQPGERLQSVSAGDTVRWIVGDSRSGTGAKEQVHILVKPVAADLQTNLVIHTDRRSYHLELISDDETYMASLSWTYPKDELLLLKKVNAKAEKTEAAQIASGINVKSLRFRYRIEGKAPFKPTRVFDDGRKVYIRFPDTITQGAAPPLFILGSHSKLSLVNYRMKHPYYIVDRLFAAAELRHGEDPQHVVRIIRRDAVWK